MELKLNALVFVFVVACGATSAQQGGDEQRAAMARFDWLVGDWEGSGWVDRGSGRSEFFSTERVRRAAGGAVITIEGVHYSKTGQTRGAVVHDAFAVISFDPQSRGYRFGSHLSTGQSGVFDMTASEREFAWRLPIGDNGERGRVECSAKLDADGRWVETGRFCPPQGECRPPSFHMELTRRNKP